MKVVSFNINGIRARLHQLEAIIERHSPDVIGLQETKVRDEEFPVAAIEAMGYRVHYYGQKAHYGVALMSKEEPLQIQKGFEGDPADSQRRMIIGTYALRGGDTLTVMNGYFPQGESREHPVKFPAKRAFYQQLSKHLAEHVKPDEKRVIMGDFNISPADIDIGIGDHNAKRWLRTGKCSFLPEERDWYKRVLDAGYFDTYRYLHPNQDDALSWFDYRSRGFEREPKHGLRIDHILATQPLQASLKDAGIDHVVRGMDKPSDHCPIWATFGL